MSDLVYVIIFSLIGGVVSLAGGVMLLSRRVSTGVLVRYATPFAAGALLAAVFMDLLKEGIEQSSADKVLEATLIGVVFFFFAERFLHWFHHHHQHENADPSKSLIIIGDTVHNALDGVAIAAAFLVNIPTGIVTTLAVAAHEIPQEIGDFGLLLAKGMSRKRVLLVNVFSALATTLAAVVAYMLGSQDVLPLGVLFGVSAGFLLYIALSDIIPEIHEQTSKKRFLDWQPIMLVVGVVVVGLAITWVHRFAEPQTDPPAEINPPQQCIMIYPPPPGCDAVIDNSQSQIQEACHRAVTHPTGPTEGVSMDEAVCSGTLPPE